ncbi:MAG: hypothetical protein DRQ59_13875 [Gammaproteobacteria bacterium]|jgi:hypothetical protein|nr:MAG: hypothetical protein DRQ59_13875 [Gammaproteobacteria bacterium]
MAEKQKIIKQMLDLQQKFIKIEQNGEFKIDEYYDSEGDSELAKYKKTYDELAVKLVDMAHAEKGSQR